MTTPPPFTKSGLFSFLDMSLSKGMVNANTGNAWKAASGKVLGDLSDDASVDNLDLRAAILRYNNLNPGELTGESLKKYEQRTRTAIEQFIQWKTDPLNYKPPSRGLPGEKDAPKKQNIILRRTRSTVNIPPAPDSVYKHTTPMATVTNGAGVTPPPVPGTLTVPIPIRGGAFVVHLTIPIDMTADEAKRIGAVMTAYAHDPVPAQ